MVRPVVKKIYAHTIWIALIRMRQMGNHYPKRVRTNRSGDIIAVKCDCRDKPCITHHTVKNGKINYHENISFK